MDDFLASCGKSDLAEAMTELGLTSVEDVSMCEATDLQDDLGLSEEVAELLVTKAKEQILLKQRKAAVRGTWKAVENSLNVEATKLFYQHLFETNPGVDAMFADADMEAQAEKLLKTVTYAVESLDDMETLVPILQSLGAKHATEWGVKREHYDAVGTALIWTLKTGLGEAWIPQVADAWTWVYGVIAKTMADAGDAAIAEGESISLSDEEKKAIIKETWALVEPIAEHATKIFYKDLKLTDPAAKQLFENVDMEEQEEKLAKTLGVAVKHLDDLDTLIPVLEDLAVKHVDYGVTANMYDSVGASLLRTLEAGLGDAWTPEAKTSWTWVYTLMMDVMVAKAYPPQP